MSDVQENIKYMWDDPHYSLRKNSRRGNSIDQNKFNFVLAMLQENLQHVRHVENERITYHGFFAAMVAGALALIAGMADKESLIDLFISICICFLLMVLGYITLQLCGRWSNAFERHLEYAKGCYYFLHKTLFGEKNYSAKDLKYEEMQEALKIEAYYDNEGTAEPELKLHCMPLYCFRIRNPVLPENMAALFRKNAERTKVLFRTFDHATIFILRVVIFFLVYELFSVLCEEDASLIPYLYNDGCRAAVYFLISVGCAIVLVCVVKKISVLIATIWKRKQLSKKTGIELNIGISKGAKAVLFVIVTVLLSMVFRIHMDHIMNGVDFFYRNTLELAFLHPDHFYKILLNGSWAIIAAIICKYFAICVERWVADIYNDDNRKKREENDHDTTHSS